MFRNRQNRSYWIVSASLMVTLCSTGCRSGMSRTNMFGMRSEPSAEALAGNGPTATYPSPPGDSATPQAIASIAAGTGGSAGDPITAPFGVDNGTAQVAGLDIKPGYVTPASSNAPVTNMAAAQANGIFNEKLPSYASSGPQPTGTAGYQYGSKSTSLSSAAATSSPTAAMPSAYGSPASMTPPSTTYASTSTTPPAVSGGFMMPDNVTPTTASKNASKPLPSASVTPPPIPSAAAEPEHRIASSDPDSMMPSIDTGAPTSAPSTSPSGYMPGSTAGAVGYPTGGYSKPSTTGGSFYR